MNLRKLVRLLPLFVLVAVALVPVVPAAAAPQINVGFNVRFTGVIETVPAAAGDAWMIGGQTLAVDANTQVILTAGPAAVGMWADVAAKRQPDNSLLAKQINVRAAQPRLRGEVSAKPTDPTGVGAWTISGLTVNVTADTKIDDHGGPIDVGSWVDVAFSVGTDGSLTALRLSRIAAQRAVEISGAIQAFDATQWTLSGIVVKINGDTLISGTPAIDLIGHAAAALQDDGSLLGLGLRVAWIENNMFRAPVEFTGVIQAMDNAVRPRVWTVDGKEVWVMPNTQINQEKGLAMVGATVDVVAWQDPTAANRFIASSITVLESPEAGGTFILIRGQIKALPAGTLLGNWTVTSIGGTDYTVVVLDTTLLEGITPAVGEAAVVDGVKRADGTVVATRIRVRTWAGLP